MKKKYDEFQKMKRQKIGNQAFLILLAIIFINGAVKERYGMWAEPLVEAQMLALIPALYVLNVSIWQNAYIRMNEDSKFMLVITGIGSLFGFIIFILYLSTGTLLEFGKGVLDGTVFPLIVFSVTASAYFSLLGRRMLDRRMG